MTDNPWHRAGPVAFARLKEQIAWEYPELHFLERGDQLVLSGIFPIAEDGRVIDRYRIEVTISPRSPRIDPQIDLPVVKEVGERIPRDVDHHMEKDGKACLFVTEDFWFNNPGGMDLLAFLNGPVRAFFVGQSLMERGEPDPWSYGVRPHGNEGIADFYAQFFGTADPRRVKDCLEALAAKKLRVHKPCPCGSGRPIRTCHLSTFQQLRARVPRRAFLASLARFGSG